MECWKSGVVFDTIQNGFQLWIKEETFFFLLTNSYRCNPIFIFFISFTINTNFSLFLQKRREESEDDEPKKKKKKGAMKKLAKQMRKLIEIVIQYEDQVNIDH